MITRRLAWVLGLSLGLGVLGLTACGGAEERSADPSAGSRRDPATAVQLESEPRTAAGKVIMWRRSPRAPERRQAHLVSPASAAFIKLGNASSRAKTGQDLVGPTQNLVLSPVVIAMWRPMAEAIRRQPGPRAAPPRERER